MGFPGGSVQFRSVTQFCLTLCNPMDCSMPGFPVHHPGGSVVKNPPTYSGVSGATGDVGSISGSGRSPGRGNDYSLQYSCLENSMDRGAWQATVHRVTKSRTQLHNLTLLLFTLNIFCSFILYVQRIFFFGPKNFELTTMMDNWLCLSFHRWKFLFCQNTNLI